MTKFRGQSESDPAIIEMIVREVMQRLSQTNHQNPSSLEALDAKSSQTVSAENKRARDTLILDQKVITLESLRGRLEGLQSIVVERGAIVTPAVQDELRDRGIKLEFRSLIPAGKDKENGSASPHFCLARLAGHFVPTEWLKTAGLGHVCTGEDYTELAKQVGEKYADHPVICFAAQPYLAVATLNRNTNLRAALGRTTKEVNEIKSTLNANVLVLDAVQNKQDQLGLIRCFVEPDRRGKS